ncbi:MAG TPA: fructosamine kinase family protein [Chitinophagaceae bacterium]|nr:fructosamine kinase family protein [Chitinophagaceae bacterium]
MLSPETVTAVVTVLENVLHQKIILQGSQKVLGGDINETHVLQTSAGKFFLKINSATRPGMFEQEYKGLQLLASANALAVPAPIATGKAGINIFLVMEYIKRGNTCSDFWQQFGAGLAAQHRKTNDYFGLDEHNYIGTVQQDNTATPSWAGFYTHQRIMPLMQLALQQHKCSVKDVQLAEKLCSRFDKIFPKELPALLHGDLWGGNFMVGKNGQPVIYDPAVYYGHREMDIAMTLLFGGFDRKFYDYYNDAWPLEQGWQQRVQLCQLYPLLVHLLLFDGHYYNNVMEIIKRY